MFFSRHFLRMRATEQIIRAIEVYCSYKKLSERYVSDLIFSSNTAVLRLRKNSGITLRSFEKAMSWLSSNWPADLPWPDGVQKYPASPPQKTGAHDEPQ